MRCFIALDIDDSLKQEFERIQHKLKKEADLKKGDAAWVNPEKIHLTLKFLGETDEALIPEICKAVERATADRKSFDLDLCRIGSFGRKSARVVWIGCDESRELEILHQRIEEELQQLSVAGDNKKFSAHLTLCRVKNFKAGVRIKKVLKNFADLRLGPLMIDSVAFYESRLQSNGAVYTKLGTFNLK